METAADGSGTIVPAQNVASGSPITVYAISRDANNNFIANVTGTWSLTSITGGVTGTDLVPSGDNKSATFTGHAVGSAIIHVVSGSLASIDSGIITVTARTLNKFVFNTITDQIAGISFSITIRAVDAFGNTITSYNGIANLSDLSGSLFPNTTTAFSNGLWTGSVTITSPWTNDTITATSGSITGTSNAFNVSARSSPPTPPTTSVTIPVTTPITNLTQLTLTVNFLGKITSGPMSNDGTLLNSLVATSPDGSHSLTIDPGTRVLFNNKIVTSIVITEAAQVPQVPDGRILLDQAYDFEPSGITFSKPISLTLGYDVNKLTTKVASVSLTYYKDGSGWTDLQAASGTVAGLGKITAPTDHFTIFAVLGNLTPVNFNLSNLTVTPSIQKYQFIFTFARREGKTASVSADLTNNGGQQGSYTATLKFDGKVTTEKTITLSPDGSTQAQFQITGYARGSHTVQIGNLSGNFVSSLWINRWLIAAIIIIILIALLLAGWQVYKHTGLNKKRTIIT